MLKLDVHAGLFNKGTNPLQSQNSTDLSKENVFASTIYAKGVSARLSFRKNSSLNVSDVMKVYRNQDQRNDLKDIVATEGKKEAKKETFGYVISLEGVYLTQRLRDADDKDNLTNFNAWAMDFKVRFLLNKFKVNMDFIMRNPEFLLFNVPGLTAFESISRDPNDEGEKSEVKNEMFFSIGGEYKTTEHLNLGFLVGYKLPASYKGAGAENVLVIKDREDQSSFTSGLSKNKVRLPKGDDAKPILALKLSAFYELSDSMEVSGEVSYLMDENDSTVDESGKRVLRTKSETNKLGFALYIRSSF